MLSNRVVGLSHRVLLSCFISKLKLHIQGEVQALQSINLMHAVDLAKLEEENLFEIRKYQHSSYSSTSFSSNHFHSS